MKRETQKTGIEAHGVRGLKSTPWRPSQYARYPQLVSAAGASWPCRRLEAIDTLP